MKLVPPLKWHGGKAYLADWIIGLMPKRCKNPNKPALKDKGWLHYVEPYFGGGQVLFALNPEGISEVANDVNRDLTDFWRVLQGTDNFKRFVRMAQAVPFSEEEYRASGVKVHDPICNAMNFFVRCRQSLAGRMKGFTGITKTRTRRGMNNEASAWLSVVDGLPEVHERLRRVLIVNRDALEVIRKHDGKQTLFYADPPYLHETRATNGEFMHEMTARQHAELLDVLGEIKGRFLLSGYRHRMYDNAAKMYGWKRHEKKIDNKAAGGKTKRIMTECVWTNY